MLIGLTKKLQPQEVRQYKTTWEARCQSDMFALARDRENFYVALYKILQEFESYFQRSPQLSAKWP